MIPFDNEEVSIKMNFKKSKKCLSQIVAEDLSENHSETLYGSIANRSTNYDFELIKGELIELNIVINEL